MSDDETETGRLLTWWESLPEWFRLAHPELNPNKKDDERE